MLVRDFEFGKRDFRWSAPDAEVGGQDSDIAALVDAPRDDRMHCAKADLARRPCTQLGISDGRCPRTRTRQVPLLVVLGCLPSLRLT